MSMDVEHFFMFLLAISTSSLENCLFSAFAPFFSGSFIFIVRMRFFLCLLYILVINSDVWLTKIFPHFVGCLFSLVNVSFAGQKFLVSCSSIYQSFLLFAEVMEFY
jgi:hypothetical protein